MLCELARDERNQQPYTAGMPTDHNLASRARCRQGWNGDIDIPKTFKLSFLVKGLKANSQTLEDKLLLLLSQASIIPNRIRNTYPDTQREMCPLPSSEKLLFAAEKDVIKETYNWSKCRELTEGGVCGPNLHTYNATPRLRLRRHLRRGSGKTVSTRGLGHLLGNRVFDLWQEAALRMTASGQMGKISQGPNNSSKMELAGWLDG